MLGNGAERRLKPWSSRQAFATPRYGILCRRYVKEVLNAPGVSPDSFNNLSLIHIFFHIVNYPGAQATAIVGINDAGDLCGSEGGTNFADARAFVAIPQQ